MTKTASAAAGFVAIVLAGDRTENDPVALSAAVSCKAIAPICGRAMVLRVLDALEKSELLDSIVLCGPPETSLNDCPELIEKIKQANISWLPNLDSPSQSVEFALETVSADKHVLLTTADHALLTVDIVDYFLAESQKSSADANVGLVKYEAIVEKLPQVKRTVINLSDGGVCSCNLFTFMNVNGRKLTGFWRQVEEKRKRPARMIAGILGLWGVFLYLAGQLKLDKALSRVSARLKIEVKPVLLPYPEAGVDVDTAADRELVEAIVQKSML